MVVMVCKLEFKKRSEVKGTFIFLVNVPGNRIDVK